MNTKINLEGVEFTLELNGSLKVDSGTRIRSVRGHHEYDGDYEESYYEEHFEGEGALGVLSGEEFFFRFSTPIVYKRTEGKTLKEKVLTISKNDLSKVTDQKLLIDYLCKKILQSLELQLKDKAKAMRYGLSFEFNNETLDHNELIAGSILTTNEGQILLPLG